MPYATTIDLGDYLDEDCGRLELDRVEERIDELKELRAEYEDGGALLDDDLAEELRLLLAFVGGLRQEFDMHTHMLTLVPKDEFVRFVRWEAEVNDGIGPDNVGDFVKWDEYADNLRHQWTTHMLDFRDILVRDDA